MNNLDGFGNNIFGEGMSKIILYQYDNKGQNTVGVSFSRQHRNEIQFQYKDSLSRILILRVTDKKANEIHNLLGNLNDDDIVTRILGSLTADSTLNMN